jgi:lysozyme family protein
MMFNKAFDKTLKNEGGFTNDPIDRGGMTFLGIARRYHPSWSGWVTIDKIIAAGGHPDQLFKTLDQDVRSFYRREFWDRCNGDSVPLTLSVKLFDTAVNVGVTTACKWLQECLNVLNRNGKDYPDLIEDGKIGPATLRAITSLNDNALLLTTFSFRQGAHYLALMKSGPKQERFARGWLKRAKEGV